MASLFGLDNPVYRAYLGYSSLLLMKAAATSLYTVYFRLTNKAYPNEEDTYRHGGPKKVAPTLSDPDVERARRIHRNDLENVVPFVLLGLLYVSTGPSLWAATLHFRVFTAARFLHTLVYVLRVKQPSRFLAFLAGYATFFSMGYNVITSGAL